MTTSSNDAEALVALGKANRILAEAKVTWPDLLDALSHEDAPPREEEPEFEDVGDANGKRYRNAQEINVLFARVYQKNIQGSSLAEFIESIHMFWTRRRYLTEKQFSALKRAAR